jgi:hypothetical protein
VCACTILLVSTVGSSANKMYIKSRLAECRAIQFTDGYYEPGVRMGYRYVSVLFIHILDGLYVEVDINVFTYGNRAPLGSVAISERIAIAVLR